MGRIARLLNSALAVITIASGPVVPVASAADTFYFGRWKIVSAVVAPWSDESVRRPDSVEMKTLVGAAVTFEATAIRPRALACSGTRYQVRDDPADMLFQGAFGEMHERDKSADPAKIAAALGFRGSRWKTLETGCGNEIDYHFIDSTTTAFGLNDYVYILKKQR